MNIENIIEQLKSISKSTEKIRILNEHKNNENLKKLFRYVNSPTILSNIKNTTIPEISGSADFENISESFFSLYDDLSNRVITGNTARDMINSLLVRCTPGTQSLIVKALGKDLECGIAIGTIEKVWPKMIDKFEVQLANKYDPNKKYSSKYFFATPKLDGLRCVYMNGKLFTRSGKDIIGYDHIIKILDEINDKYNIPYIDGELYSHSVPFQTIQGTVTRSKNINEFVKQQIFFNVFACANIVNGKLSAYTSDDMYHKLNLIDDNCKESDYIKVLHPTIINNNPDNIEKLCKSYMNSGYEGVMLRNPACSYIWKRSNELLKYKMFLEDDFKITGMYEGNKGKEGTLGGISVVGKLKVDGKYVTIKCNCGSGFTDEERDYFWNNQEELIGKLVELKYQGVTDREIDGKYSLRFPIYLKLKLDR